MAAASLGFASAIRAADLTGVTPAMTPGLLHCAGRLVQQALPSMEAAV